MNPTETTKLAFQTMHRGLVGGRGMFGLPHKVDLLPFWVALRAASGRRGSMDGFEGRTGGVVAIQNGGQDAPFTPCSHRYLSERLDPHSKGGLNRGQGRVK
jgi:hypothetical protein